MKPTLVLGRKFDENLDRWHSAIDSCLKTKNSYYSLIEKKSNVGEIILVYRNTTTIKIEGIEKSESTNVKLAWLNNNDCGVIARLYYNNLSFCFVSCNVESKEL